MKTSSKILLSAVAGLIGAAAARADEPIPAHRLGKMEVVPCYGINSCKATGQCSGPNHACGGGNGCRGQGWLAVPKEACLAIPGGSLAPIKEGEKKADKADKHTANTSLADDALL